MVLSRPIASALTAGMIVFTCLPQNSSATVAALPGTTPQTARALTPFVNAPSFKVTDESGAPVNGVTVQLQAPPTAQMEGAEPGSGCYSEFGFGVFCGALTDARGVAVLPRLKSNVAGTHSVRIRADLGSRSFGTTVMILIAEPVQAPVSLSVVSGNHQTAAIASPLAAPIVIRLVDSAGLPVQGAAVGYGAAGTARFSPEVPGPSRVTTDARGLAQLPPLIVGWGTGANTATVNYFDQDAHAMVAATIDYMVTNAEGGLDLRFQDLWWSGPQENGWGMSVVQHRDQLFNVYFVYDDAGKPTWFVQPGGQWHGGLGASFSGDIYSPRGSPWFAYDASRLVVGPPVASSPWVSFQGLQLGYMSAVFDRKSVQKTIVRQDFRRAGISPISGVGDMWWGGPEQSGWGVAILEQPGSLFIVWFTYDEAGVPTWFVMPGGEWIDSKSYAGTLYRTSGSAWVGATYDAARLQVGAVGPYVLRFDSTERATLEATVDGRAATLQLQRQPF